MKESLHQQNKSIKKAKSLKSPLLDPYRSSLLNPHQASLKNTDKQLLSNPSGNIIYIVLVKGQYSPNISQEEGRKIVTQINLCFMLHGVSMKAALYNGYGDLNTINKKTDVIAAVGDARDVAVFFKSLKSKNAQNFGLSLGNSNDISSWVGSNVNTRINSNSQGVSGRNPEVSSNNTKLSKHYYGGENFVAMDYESITKPSSLHNGKTFLNVKEDEQYKAIALVALHGLGHNAQNLPDDRVKELAASWDHYGDGRGNAMNIMMADPSRMSPETLWALPKVDPEVLHGKLWEERLGIFGVKFDEDEYMYKNPRKAPNATWKWSINKHFAGKPQVNNNLGEIW